MLNIFRTKRKTWAIKTRNDSEGIECVLQNWRRQSIKKTLCMIQLYSILAKLLYFPNYSQWLCCKMIIRCLSPSLAEKTVYTMDFSISCILPSSTVSDQDSIRAHLFSHQNISHTSILSLPVWFHFLHRVSFISLWNY